jgi:hypothetical protein
MGRRPRRERLTLCDGVKALRQYLLHMDITIGGSGLVIMVIQKRRHVMNANFHAAYKMASVK